MIDDPREDTAIERARRIVFERERDAFDNSVRTLADIAARLGTGTLAKNIKTTPDKLSSLIKTLGKIQKAMPPRGEPA